LDKKTAKFLYIGKLLRKPKSQ